MTLFDSEAMMVPAPPSRHILDPAQGYDLDLIGEDRRIDYRRVELGTFIIAADILFEVQRNSVRNIAALWVILVIAALGAIFFSVRARRAQRDLALADPWLTEGFVLFVLLCLNVSAYFGVEGIRVSMGYPMAYLAAAAFFMIPPRRFIAIGLSTYALFVGWVSTLEISTFDKLYPIVNGGLAVVAGGFGRASIDRIQQIGLLHRRHIAKQNLALKHANSALERQNSELNDLMMIAAHDLRSPLFGLRSVLDLARSHPPETPDKLERLLEAASSSITAMVALVGRLLDVHEVEGRVPPALGRMDLTPVLTAAVQRVLPQAAAAGVAIEVESPGEAVVALAHAGSAQQILDNLLANAIRFSPSGSTVRAIVRIVASRASIEVIDTGAGVPEFERASLFGKFRRGSTPPFHGQKGSGLGLYVVRVLAEAMGARCHYRPNAGGGSIFQVHFRAC